MSAGADLEQVGRRAVEAALGAGADEADAWVEQSREREIRVYVGAVESLTDAGSQGVGVRVFLDGRSGYAFGTDLSDDGLREVAREARTVAAVADPDEHEGLPETCGATEVSGLHDPALAEWSTAHKVELAVAVERAARAHPHVSQVEDTVYADGEQRVALANSRGFTGSYETSSAYAVASAFAGEGADLMTGIGVGLGRAPGDIDPDAIGLEAADRAAALRGARQPAGRRCPVVLDAFVAASFVGFIGAMLSADQVQRGRSLFADREGEEIAAPLLRLGDDGTDPQGFASSPFDGEGGPRRALALVEQGRLATFLFDSRTARRAGGGRASTGSAQRASYRSPPSVGATNLMLEPGEDSLADLLGRAGEGLYVTDVVGLHSGVNPVSGQFSVGATGRLIEGGELGTPVRELTIASDLVTMLRSVSGVGAQTRWVPFGGSVRAAPVLLGEMTVSGS